MVDKEKAVEHYRQYMEALGIETDSVHSSETPERVVDSRIEEIFEGQQKDPSRHLQTAFPAKQGDDELVIVDNITVHSMCAHHHLPMTGYAHIGYIPDGEIVGLSKFSRLVDGYARRPQVQERLTAQIADCINSNLSPKATIVLIEASHDCMKLRGVEEQNSTTRTTALRGKAKTDSHIKQEFLNTLNGCM